MTSVARHIAATLLIVIIPAYGSAQTPPQRTYANPIDVDYRYNFEQKNAGISYRSGADPVIVVHRGEYYLWVKRTGSRSRASTKTVFRP